MSIDVELGATQPTGGTPIELEHKLLILLFSPFIGWLIIEWVIIDWLLNRLGRIARRRQRRLEASSADSLTGVAAGVYARKKFTLPNGMVVDPAATPRPRPKPPTDCMVQVAAGVYMRMSLVPDGVTHTPSASATSEPSRHEGAGKQSAADNSERDLEGNDDDGHIVTYDPDDEPLVDPDPA